MRALLSLSFVSLFFLNGRSQQLDSFFDKPPTSYSLSDFREYYISTYGSFEKINDVAHKNAVNLKEIDEYLYFFHELSRVQFFDLCDRKEDALALIAKLEPSTVIQSSPQLLGYLYNVKGGIDSGMNHPTNALKNYLEAYRQLTVANDSVGIKANAINVANMYTSQGIYDKAKYYYNTALQLEYKGIMPFSNQLRANYGQFLVRNNKLDSAIEMYSGLLENSGDQLDNYARSIIQMNLGDAYMLNGQPDSAISHLQIAKQHSSHQDVQRTIIINRSLSEYHYRKKDYTTAYLLLRESDSLSILEQNRQIPVLSENLKLEYERKIHEKEMDFEKVKTAHEKSKITRMYIFSAVTLLFLAILIFLYFRIQKKHRLLAEKNIELANQSANTKKSKNKGKAPSPDLITLFEQQLHDAEIFIDPELTLDKLSKKLGTNRTYLSENINLHYGKSFRSIINELRIAAARRMLIDEKYAHYSIEGVAISVGYRNISSFNSAFKKETGITPSFFRKTSQSSD
ncbi:MAG: helix-turn-helix domain-containing protein [Crocinitomicaceae bacterium]|nr:helix-turn-helix domain-containing protein [Crocinitomicaceae bacterium]